MLLPEIENIIYKMKHQLELSDSLKKIEQISYFTKDNCSIRDGVTYVYHNKTIFTDHQLLLTIENSNKFIRIQDVKRDDCVSTRVYQFDVSNLRPDFESYVQYINSLL